MNTIQNSDLQIIELKNSSGSVLQILNYGAAIFSFKMKNSKGKLINLVVGPNMPEDYLSPSYFDENKCFGATVGRFAGRISGGTFKIEDKTHQLHQDNGVHLHGGKSGFQYKIWEVEKEEHGENPSVTLSYLSEAMEEGYPGNLQVRAKYTLTETNEIEISYSAITDEETIVNLTNHSYFNLNGGGSVSDHFFSVHASKILELNEKQLPTGNLLKVKNTPLDYRDNRLLGNRELDDVFVTDVMEDDVQAQLFSPLSGIKMQLKSNQPVLVVYSPQKLPEDWKYTSDIDNSFPAVAIEAQNYPDAPNFRNFPTSYLKPGEMYQNEITISFSVNKNE